MHGDEAHREALPEGVPEDLLALLKDALAAAAQTTHTTRLQQALLAAGRAQDEADRLWAEARQIAKEAGVYVVYPSTPQRN
jgi:hypothetical protein